ncbi:hypothetical protein DsansV1_C05g0054241 [Dioscorea sansibarensis]
MRNMVEDMAREVEVAMVVEDMKVDTVVEVDMDILRGRMSRSMDEEEH